MAEETGKAKGLAGGAIEIPSEEDVDSSSFDDLSRRIGKLRAEVADLQAKLGESHAREEALATRLARAEETVEDGSRTEHELRERIASYEGFHRDLDRSRSWRILKIIRRAFGVRW